ncbi:hypothetical protein HDV06_006778 [Boothiomyces sp. JEL0866]|nr:hypothetical protein HDV06_006778 [Boothiomyces sp. JEL0866]
MYKITTVLLIILYAFTIINLINLCFNVNFGRKSVKLFNVQFNIVLGFNILQCLIVLFWEIFSVLDSNSWQVLQSQIFLVSGIVGNIQLHLIFTTDIQILSIFSILSEKIKKIYLKVLEVVFTIFFLIVVTFSTLSAVFVNDLTLAEVSNTLVAFYAPLVVFYNNLQTFYVLSLIYRFKQSKIGSIPDQMEIKRFVKVGKLITLVLLLDWIGIGFYIAYMVLDIEIGTLCVFVSYLSISSHTYGIIHIIQLLTKLSLGKPVKRKPAEVHSATAKLTLPTVKGE